MSCEDLTLLSSLHLALDSLEIGASSIWGRVRSFHRVPSSRRRRGLSMGGLLPCHSSHSSTHERRPIALAARPESIRTRFLFVESPGGHIMGHANANITRCFRPDPCRSKFILRRFAHPSVPPPIPKATTLSVRRDAAELPLADCAIVILQLSPLFTRRILLGPGENIKLKNIYRASPLGTPPAYK